MFDALPLGFLYPPAHIHELVALPIALQVEDAADKSPKLTLFPNDEIIPYSISLCLVGDCSTSPTVLVLFAHAVRDHLGS